MQSPLVLVTEPLDPAPMSWLAQRARVVQAAPGVAGFDSVAAEAAGMVVRTYTTVDAALLAQMPRLQVVGRAGVGLDNIDLPTCRARQVQVVHTPDANTQAVVEYVLCLLCDTLRPRLFLNRALDAAAWNAARADVRGDRQMSQMQLGILGMGRIGQRVAQVARAIGFRVAYTDIVEVPDAQRHGAMPVSVEQLFATSDVVTLHIDGRPSNRGYVNAALLERMRPDAVLLNTCRGMVLDTAALAAFLRAHPKATAVLDVHEPEPFGADYPLLGLSNALLAPHLASRTATAMEAMSWVVRDVWAVLQGERPQWPAPVHPGPADSA